MFLSILLLAAAQGALAGGVAEIQAANSVSGSGGVSISGSSALAQLPELVAASGSTATAASTGSGAVAQQSETVAVSGLVAISGSSAVAQAKNTDTVLATSLIVGSAPVLQLISSINAYGAATNPTGVVPGAIFHLDASAIPAQGDNTSVASWSDSTGSFNAVQATAASQPKYRTNRAAGRASVQCQGGQWLVVDGTGALKTAIDSGTFTLIMAISNVVAASNAGLFGSNSGGNNGLFAFADGVTLGRFDGQTTGHAAPWAKSDFVTLAITNNAGGNYGGLAQAMERIYINGFPQMSGPSPGVMSASSLFAVGAKESGGTNTSKVDFYDIYVYDRELSPVEILTNEIAIRQKNGQPLPWSGQTYIDIADGDSIEDGITASRIQDRIPYLVAQARNKPYGTYGSFAIGGIRTTQSTAKASEWTGIAALLGIPLKVCFFEWANEHSAGKSPATIFSDMQAYVQTVRIAAPSTKLLIGTSTAYGGDATDPYATVRGAYNSLMDDPATGAAVFADAYVPMHNDPYVGTGTAYANYPNTYIGGDTLHPTTAGYAVIASLFIPAMSVLDASTNSFGAGAPATHETTTSAGTVSISGSGAPAQSSAVVSGVAIDLDSSYAMPSQAASTMSAAGTVGSGAVGAVVQQPQSVVITAFTIVSATGTMTQAHATTVAGVQVNVSGIAAIVERPAVLGTSGIVSDPGVATGSASSTEGINTATAVGQVGISSYAALSQSETMQASGTVLTGVGGAIDVVQGNDQIAVSGTVEIDGLADTTQQVATMAALGAVFVAGSVSGDAEVTQDADVCDAFGLIVTGDFARYRTYGMVIPADLYIEVITPN